MTTSIASPATPQPVKNRGWIVAFSGLGINLALGVLYTWSLFKGAIEQQFGWKGSQLNDPYALACLMFAFSMVIAGRSQDRFGPRVTASIGGVLVGAGMVLIATTSSYALWLLGFGVLVGTGIGFGYSSATPPALKWFPPSKTGVIAGTVVAGFGLAPVYLAPASQYLLGRFGVHQSLLILGIAFVVIIVGLAQMLRNPPAGFVPGSAPSRASGAAPHAPPPAGPSATPSEMLRQPAFWLLWILFFIGAGAGLMVIGSVSGMAKNSMGDLAFVAVAVLAVGNAGGRVLAGALSDRIGRRSALALVLALQAALMFLAIPITGAKGSGGALILLLAALIGANYGANLSLFPSFAKDLWGLKNFGMNYGILFTSWGVGGLVLSRLQQTLTAASGGSFTSSFVTAGVLLLVGTALTFFVASRRPEPAPAR